MASGGESCMVTYCSQDIQVSLCLTQHRSSITGEGSQNYANRQEKQYYLKWASDEYRNMKDSNDEYLIKMKQLDFFASI